MMKRYTIGGAVVGLMQVVDAVLLAQRSGAAGGVVLAFAGLEFLWAIVSLVVAIRVSDALTRRLASIFFLYNLFGWGVSIFLGTAATVPAWAVYAGGIFGLLY